MKNEQTILDQLVECARGKGSGFDAETRHYEQLWKSLSEDDNAFSDIFRCARRKADDSMTGDRQMAIVLAQLVVHEMVIRGISAQIDSELSGGDVDMPVHPGQSVEGGMSVEDLRAMFNAPSYEKPE